MLWRLCRVLIGLALLPLCGAASRACFRLVRELQPGRTPMPPDACWLIGGFVFWLLLYAVLSHPVRTYVLAHELTHALWGWVMGARVSNLKVKGESGSVTLSKTNFLIILAPYFFPLYTVLTLAVYGILGLFVAVEQYHLWWMGMIGFTWGFHFTFTIKTLLQKQSDIRTCGHLFSYSVIYLMNVLGIGLWVVAVTPATLERFVALLGRGTVDMLRLAGDLGVALLEFLQ